MDKPKPCPFCGAELDLIETSDDRQRFYRHPYSICCLDGFEVDEFDGDLAAWNSRAPWTVTRERAAREIGFCLGFTGVRSEKIEALVEALGGKVEG